MRSRSQRVFRGNFKYVDPYARFEYVMPFAAGGSRFKDYGAGQQYIGPGDRMQFELGTEVAPFYNPETGAKVYFDIGFSAMYQAEGRDYSELFDAIGMANTPCTDPNGPATDARVVCLIKHVSTQTATVPQQALHTMVLRQLSSLWPCARISVVGSTCLSTQSSA